MTSKNLQHSSTVSFRARARTIDHLGKGQIADCPTAVSELWKNSYDAYARFVALHTFDGPNQCGAIIDDGCGMSLPQVIDSWLVVGTESKSTKNALPASDRFGLPIRKTQGEKGIGRLSCAFLAPVTLLITKKVDTDYSVALIDWRLFENTYLSLEDIQVPYVECSTLADVHNHFEVLVRQLEENLYVAGDFGELRPEWQKFGFDQLTRAGDQENFKTTAESVQEFCRNFSLPPGIFDTWDSVLEETVVRDGAAHGTALFLLDLERELSLLTRQDDLSGQNFEFERIKHDLIDTLRAFVDPFNSDEQFFRYEIKSFDDSGRPRTLLQQSDVFNLSDFLNLEHVVQGKVDERGWFIGNVKAFGQDNGTIKIPPSIELDRNGTKVGAFELKLGTFENEADKSSLSQSEHALLQSQTNKYTGLMIFRDGLRVLPYGRGDNDFFEIEERRSKNAGRYYWSRRRIFGQILITHDNNSLLKDKAGREGFIKNRAARELKALVESILVTLADRYFGKNSDARTELLEIVRRERDARKEAQSKARAQSFKSFITDLRKQEPTLQSELTAIKVLESDLLTSEDFDANRIISLAERLQRFEALRTDLRTPTKPPKLGENEERYRNYRDMYAEFGAHVTSLRKAINRLETKVSFASPTQSAKRNLERNQASLNAMINRKLTSLTGKISDLARDWELQARNDRGQYYQLALHFVEHANEENINTSLNALDATYEQLTEQFIVKYSAIERAIDRLQEGVNLDAAFSMAEEERSELERKVRDLHALAQLGISVEILAHELEVLDSLVTSGLNSLPSELKSSHPGFKTAYNAHKALTQQIRFLSPLKLSGYQMRRDIHGYEIRDHIERFFADRFSRQRVAVEFGANFLQMKIKDIPSRIYPVFVNILNNALYWVSLENERRIQIDVVNDEVIIANSGPPVDEDDVPRLFELFYSKRSNGHGVGLYLCRENLAVAHHKIRYAEPGDNTLIHGGANFVITFNNMEFV